MLQHSKDFPWLCLCLYKPLLFSKNVDVALKVALHLQSISPHLSVAPKSALLTLVFMPILHKFAGTFWDLLPDPSTHVATAMMDDIAFIVFGMILQFLEESSVYLKLFIRHGGLKALNKLLELDSSGASVDSSSAFNCGALSLILDLSRIATGKAVPTLSHTATVAVFKPNPKQQPDKQLELAPGEPVATTGVRSFFRGISFSWGNDKRRLKDAKERSSTIDITSLKQESSNSLSINSSIPTLQADELAIYLVQLKRFVQGALSLTGASLKDFSKDRLKKTMSFVRAVSGADSTDSESELGFSIKRKRRLSETSGYRSTSQEQLYHTLDRSSSGAQSAISSVVFSADTLQLPADGDLSKWRRLTEVWSILGTAVPAEEELCSMFLDMNGFNIAMRLLTLISLGFNSHFNRDVSFTRPTTVEQSLDNSFAKTASRHSSTSALDEEETKREDNPPKRTRSIPKINLTSPSENGNHENLKKTASLDDILSETFKFFRSTTPVDSAINTPDSIVDFELQQLILELKLNLFTSCLRICFFCAKLKDQV